MFLLTWWICSGAVCPTQPFEVYETSAQCEVALWKHQREHPGGFFSGLAGGLCDRRRMTPEDVETFRSTQKEGR